MSAVPLRVLVVDDEPLAREVVRVLLAGDPEVTVVGEASGLETIAAIETLKPDLVFLDVRMPEADGFEVLEAVGIDRAPTVVFVTAHADHALQAFDVHAIDYVLKPVDDARFARALERAKTHARQRRQGEPDARLGALMRERGGHARRFLVRDREKTIVVDADSIDWIEAADYYVLLHAEGRSHLLRETMNDLEKRLDPERFFRAHRSAIIRLDRVREIHPMLRGDSELVLEGGPRVRLSRSRRAEFERIVAGRAG